MTWRGSDQKRTAHTDNDKIKKFWFQLSAPMAAISTPNYSERMSPVEYWQLFFPFLSEMRTVFLTNASNHNQQVKIFVFRYGWLNHLKF